MKTYLLIAAIALLTYPYLAESQNTIRLTHCHIPHFSQEVLCGKHTVFEDRKAATGRQIEIQFAVVPAITEAKESDPLVVFAGGPGQGARDMGPYTRLAFTEIHETRDIILIDQRGMGASHPLKCEQPDQLDDLFSLTEAQQLAKSQTLLTQCLSELDADVTLYTQDLANADIHEILLGLGYDKVNLYGASWGTRSALFYTNQYPEHVRSVIVDGNAPLENRIPLYATADAERAIQALFNDCSNDKNCHAAYPNLAKDFTDVLAAFGETGTAVSLDDPNTGKRRTFTMTRNMFVGALRGFLYSPQYSRLIPLMIAQAKSNDFRAVTALSVAFAARLDGSGSLGATLTILCSEELSRISEQDIAKEMTKGFVGKSFYNNFKNLCEVWPKAALPEIYSKQLHSDVPTLILSGDLDPVTPPRWGDQIAKNLPNSLHLIAPNTGHNVAPVGCTSKLMAQFVNQASIDNIDSRCLDNIRRPTFFVDANGPAGTKNND